MSGRPKGPWHWTKDGRLVEAVGIDVVTGDGTGELDAYREDQNLIAAAPDLYSALVELLDAINIAELPLREESERLDRAEDAARAAIKKARGGE